MVVFKVLASFKEEYAHGRGYCVNGSFFCLQNENIRYHSLKELRKMLDHMLIPEGVGFPYEITVI